MKIDIKIIYGIAIGILVNSLILALRYENEKLVRETMLFLQSGTNPFWILLFANIILFSIAPLLFYLILSFIKKRKNGKEMKGGKKQMTNYYMTKESYEEKAKEGKKVIDKLNAGVLSMDEAEEKLKQIWAIKNK